MFVHYCAMVPAGNSGSTFSTAYASRMFEVYFPRVGNRVVTINFRFLHHTGSTEPSGTFVHDSIPRGSKTSAVSYNSSREINMLYAREFHKNCSRKS